MRLLRIGLLVLVAVPFAAVAGGRAAAPHPGRCSAPAGGLDVALPASLTIRTSCGGFLLARDGAVRRISTQPSPTPQGVEVWRDGVWDRGAHGHLVIGRGHRTLWRSSGSFPHIWEAGPIAVGRHGIAFSYGNRKSLLYVASLKGPERLVARGEFPLGWTSGGLYVGRAHDGAILFRDGKRTQRISGATSGTSAYEASSRSLYFVSRGRLFRAHGDRQQLVTGLGKFRLPSDRPLQPQLLGRLVALHGTHRLVVLRPGGSLVASTPLPSRRRNMIFSGQPTAAARTGNIAFAVLRPDHAVVSQRIERGVETVYLLRPGARAAVPVLRTHMRFNVCGHGATLSWHGDWLLYGTGEGPGALVDTSGGHVVDLTSVVRSLPGFTGVDESGPLFVGWS